MKSFTPGPWRSNESAVICNFGAVAICADMDGHHISDAAVISTLFTYQQACEHADLIARAPALLADNERFRAALREIAAGRSNTDLAVHCCRYRRVAAAALKVTR